MTSTKTGDPHWPVPIPAVLGKLRLAGPPLPEPRHLPPLLRGAVARLFADDPEFHGHAGTGTLYRYPLVHYRLVDGTPAIFAIGPQGERVQGHSWCGIQLLLGRTRHTVQEVHWHSLTLSLDRVEVPQRYRFGAPWLALSQDNHRRYRGLGQEEKRAELGRILVGNLLSACKGLGWNVPADLVLHAEVEVMEEVACQVKDVAMCGFDASFRVNLGLPPYLALGRSVSRGFGWIRPAGAGW